ncbi:MAG: hypothetical protein HPY65_06515 [Syntrophaceae bacterium]|nr:hypothetical protein [Syntrophaceae bacterium]
MQKMTTVHRQEMAAGGAAPEEDFTVGSVRDLIKREVTETLLQFKDPLALDLLREGLQRDNWEEKMDVVSLIGAHRAWDLIGDVMALVKTLVIREEDIVHNERIIREIAATGDPAVIPHLHHLARIRWSFSPRRMARMRRLIRELLPSAS